VHLARRKWSCEPNHISVVFLVYKTSFVVSPFPKAQRLKSPLNRLPHFMQLLQNWPHHFTLYALTLPLDQTCQTPTTQQWYHTRIFNPECKQASISLAYPNGESSSERLQRKMLGQSSVIAYIPSSESHSHYLIVEVDSSWADNHQSTIPPESFVPVELPGCN